MGKNIIQRIQNKIYTKITVPLTEKAYAEKDSDKKLRYMFFEKKDSPVLVVVFQALYDKGSGYNYVRTLKGLNANELFIRDEGGSLDRGTFYLGKTDHHDTEQMTYHLIDKIVQEHDIKTIIFAGSSKGGYASVNFGLSYKNAIMIPAAPKYFLGTYLDTDEFRPILRDIEGGIGKEEIAHLDAHVKDKITNDPYPETQRVFIQYSKDEPTYELHIKDLLADLYEKGVIVSENIQKYENHGDLKYYFPTYLKDTIQHIIEEE